MSTPVSGISWSSGIRELSVKADYNYYMNRNNTLDFGASVTYDRFNPGKLEGDTGRLNGDSDPVSERLTEEQGVLNYAVYVSNRQRITDRLSVRYGIRANLYQNLGGRWVYKLDGDHLLTDSFYVAKNKTFANYFSIEPRVSVNYQVSRNASVKASYTYTTQQTQLLIKTNGGGPLDVWFPSGVNFKPQTASQYSLGYVQYLFGHSLEAGIEGYYKSMNHIIDYKDGASLNKSELFDVDKTTYNFEEQLRSGKGNAYGVELMLKGSIWKIDGFVNYTYARSRRKIDGVNNGGTYLSPFDRPHTFNLFLNCNITRRLSFSTNIRLQSGQVCTVPVYAMTMFDKVITGYSDRNDYRLLSYQRIDVGLTLKGKERPQRRWHGEWNFSVTNLLNHKNLVYVNFDPSESNPDVIEAHGVYMFGILPSISYRFNF